ncbi:MAG TPA: hypothetical protein VM221_04490 [Armatimonadota bacterium]|nr:hypothetical protein [Armatimonadota bacterium]
MQLHLAVCGLALCLLASASGPACARRVGLDSDGMSKVDGQRMLVLGCYENPGTDAGLAELADAGFNLVAASSVESLGQLAAHGLFGWVNLGGDLDLSGDTDRRSHALSGRVEQLRSHPALLVWEGPDEALWNICYGPLMRDRQELRQLRETIQQRADEGHDVTALTAALARFESAFDEADYERQAIFRRELYDLLGEQPPAVEHTLAEAPARARAAAQGFLEGYHLLKRLDPDHPLWFNHAPRNSIAALAEFNRACDISGCDIYPVPEGVNHSDLRDRSLASVGAYTERMALASGGKPVWMVLQGFGWYDEGSPEQKKADPGGRERGRRPRYKETRFMAYDALVHGATGILYFGTYLVEKDSEFWADLKRVVGELAALRPLWETPALTWRPGVEIIESGPSFERGIQVMAKSYQGELYLLVVNEESESASFVLHGMDAYEKTAFHRLFEGDAVVVKDAALADSISCRGVSIYTNGTAFDEQAARMRPKG